MGVRACVCVCVCVCERERESEGVGGVFDIITVPKIYRYVETCFVVVPHKDFTRPL